jgi:hypothetical protein
MKRTAPTRADAEGALRRGESMTADEWIVSVTPAERERLGLDPNERLRAVEVSPSHVTLARLHPGVEHPRGTPALRAELSTLSLAVLLEALHAAERSGLLQYVHRDHTKWIYLHRGEVVFAASNQRVDRLGECLLRAGVLTLDQLREAERRFTPPARFGKVLVEHGFLTPRELWNGVKYQVEEIVRSLFAMPAGTVWFWEGELQPDNVVRLSLETRRLVAEGIQRSEELRKFLSVLDDPCVRLARTAGFDGPLAGMERALVEQIGGERPFAGLCEKLGLDREAAARSIQLLRLVGAVKLVRLATPASGRNGDVDELRAQAGAGVKLLGELYARVREADRNTSIDERLGRVLDDATGRFPALLSGIRLGAGGTLDPELVADRAAKLPGDRAATLAAALGELVAYLEFEIVNHPQIDDPETLLRGLAPLRQMLAS